MSSVFFIIGFVFSTLCFWLSGFDFDKRGDMMVAWAVTSTCLGFVSIIIFKIMFVVSNQSKKDVDNYMY